MQALSDVGHVSVRLSGGFMSTFFKIILTFSLILIFVTIPNINAQSVIWVGDGSYAEYPPPKESDGFRVANAPLFVVETNTRPLPTNKWWSYILMNGQTGKLWTHPVVSEANTNSIPYGVKVYCTAGWNINQTNNKDGPTDIDAGWPITLSGDNFKPRNVKARNWGDWFLQYMMYETNTGRGIDVTVGHGFPYVWLEYNNLNPIIKSDWTAVYYDKNQVDIKPKLLTSYTNDHIAFTWNSDNVDRQFAIFAPANTIFKITNNDRVLVTFTGAQKFLVVCPMNNKNDISFFYDYAYVIPRGTQVSWNYDRNAARVNTHWHIDTENLKGEANTTPLQGWIPHHYRTTTHNLAFIGPEFITSRGKLKLTAGTDYDISWKFNGLLPNLPNPQKLMTRADYDPVRMSNLITKFDQENTGYGDDLYWGGKDLFYYGQMMMIAKELNHPSFESIKSKLRTACGDWLTYQPGETAHYYAAYPRWGGLVPFGAGWAIYFTDHQLCLGYHYAANAYLGMYDKEFIETYRDMIITSVKEVANWDRSDDFFPFMRCLDIWEGHSWAGGTADVGGNNQESSSEALHTWGGMFQLGEVMNEPDMTAAAAFAYSMESQASREYWFDVYNENFSPYYKNMHSVICWGGGLGYWTYFSDNPMCYHTIQWLPLTQSMNHLVMDTNYARAEYNYMMNEVLAKPEWGNDVEDWGGGYGNVVLGFIQMFDPNLALDKYNALWDANNPEVRNQRESGITYYYANNNYALGPIKWDFHTSIPQSTVYENPSTGVRTYLVYNPRPYNQVCTVYSNGIALFNMIVPPGEIFMTNSKVILPPEFDLVGTYPLSGETNVDQRIEHIILVFSSNVSPASLSGITISGPGVTGMSLANISPSNTAHFTVTGLMEWQESYTVIIPSTVASIKGTMLGSSHSINFKLKPSPALVVKYLEPLNGTMNNPTNLDRISISFNYKMEMTTCTGVRIVGKGVTGLVPVSGDGSNIIRFAITGKINPDSGYKIIVPTSCKSVDGVSLFSNTESFFFSEPLPSPPWVYSDTFSGKTYDKQADDVTVDMQSTDAYDGNYSIKITGGATEHDVELFNGWGRQWTDRRPVNLTNYTKVEFWAKGNQPTVWVHIGNDGWGCVEYGEVRGIQVVNGINQEWKRFTVDIPAFATNINTLFGFNVMPNATLTLDGIRFINDIIMPAPPSALSLSSSTNDSRISLGWHNNATNATGYHITWSTQNIRPETATRTFNLITISNYTITNVVQGKMYYVWIEAFNASGTSAALAGKIKSFMQSVKLLASVPANKSGHLPINTSQISLSFNSNMNAASVLSSSTFSGGIPLIAVSGNGTKTIFLTLGSQLSMSTSYTLSISTNALSSMGSKLWTTYKITFTTVLENPLPFFVHLNSGDDTTGDGTWEHPFRTIGKALRSMDTSTYNVCMVAGTNLNQTTIAITNTIGGQATPIEIRGWTNRAKPRLKGSMNVLFDFTANTSNIIISGFDITNADYAFRLNGTAANIRKITIKSNTISGCSLGINAQNCSEISLIGNTCRKINYEGIMVINVSKYIIRDNRLLYGNATGLRIGGSSTPADDIAYNISAWNNGIGLHNDASGHSVIRNNVVYGNTGAGMDLWSGNHRLVNNITMSNDGNGIQGGVSTNSYNLSWGNLTPWGGIAAGTACLTVDPLILSYDSSSTQFMKIDVNSPCLDAGDPTMDYKSERRGLHLDIGVYENPRLDLIPKDPSLLQLTATGISSISIKWKENATNETGYRIYWSATNIKPDIAMKTNMANTSNHSVAGLTFSTRYYVWVEAFNAAGPSGTITGSVETFGFPKVDSVTVQPNPTSAKAAGEVTFLIRFSETMDPGIAPAVYYDPASTTGNQPCAFNGTWISNRIYSVKNSNPISGATGDGWARVRVSGARNISSVTQTPNTNFLFNIDTLAPVVYGFTANNGVTETETDTVSLSILSNNGTGTAVIRWLVSSSATTPLPTSTNWKEVMPSTFKIHQAGTSSIYLWVMDAASNISSAISVDVNYILNTIPEFENVRPSYNPIKRDQTITLANWADAGAKEIEFILFTVTGEQVWKSGTLVVPSGPCSKDGTKILVEYIWNSVDRERFSAGTYILGITQDKKIQKKFTKITIGK